ncbi:MAG: sulfur carrier protein ThiS [Bacteroidales bacterium]|nr:sulfur carrier protein ThiS [Bacteroidales bacterium]
MKITLNNREEVFEKDEMTVIELLEYKKFTFKIITVKVNGTFIKKDMYEKTIIKEGDNVAAIHLITGG